MRRRAQRSCGNEMNKDSPNSAGPTWTARRRALCRASEGSLPLFSTSSARRAARGTALVTAHASCQPRPARARADAQSLVRGPTQADGVRGVCIQSASRSQGSWCVSRVSAPIPHLTLSQRTSFLPLTSSWMHPRFGSLDGSAYALTGPGGLLSAKHVRSDRDHEMGRYSVCVLPV